MGCPREHIKLSGEVCVKLLTASAACSAGCSRYTAMEECERAGGHLLDSLGQAEMETLSEQD